MKVWENNIRKVEPLDGVFSLKLTTAFDQVDGGSMQLRHDGTFPAVAWKPGFGRLVPIRGFWHVRYETDKTVM